MGKSYEVIITAFAGKQCKKLPKQILEHLRYWAESIERLGMGEVRKLPGYHDEPLKGSRKGQLHDYNLLYENRLPG